MVERVFIVSIHVPLAEHDYLKTHGKAEWSDSIHVPLAEHDGTCH